MSQQLAPTFQKAQKTVEVPGVKKGDVPTFQTVQEQWMCNRTNFLGEFGMSLSRATTGANDSEGTEMTQWSAWRLRVFLLVLVG